MKNNVRCRKEYKVKIILKIIAVLICVGIGMIVSRTIKADLKSGTLSLPTLWQAGTQEADTSGVWNLMLVNRDHYIPKNYQVELTNLSNGKQVDSRIYSELQQMFDDSRAAGLSLFVREGYRTQEEQQAILDDKIQTYKNQGYSSREAKKLAESYVAVPGTSEHQIGLSVDINADVTKCSQDDVYQWLNDNAYKYGFIKRYPSDKTDITGVSNEPWHYRYVGKDAAKIMKEENLCLEEYLEKYPKSQ